MMWWSYSLSLVISFLLTVFLLYLFLRVCGRQKRKTHHQRRYYFAPVLLALVLLWLGGFCLLPRLLDLHSLYYGIYRNETVVVEGISPFLGHLDTDHGRFHVNPFSNDLPALREKVRIRYLPWSRYGYWMKEKTQP